MVMVSSPRVWAYLMSRVVDGAGEGGKGGMEVLLPEGSVSLGGGEAVGLVFGEDAMVGVILLRLGILGSKMGMML